MYLKPVACFKTSGLLLKQWHLSETGGLFYETVACIWSQWSVFEIMTFLKPVACFQNEWTVFEIVACIQNLGMFFKQWHACIWNELSVFETVACTWNRCFFETCSIYMYLKPAIFFKTVASGLPMKQCLVFEVSGLLFWKVFWNRWPLLKPVACVCNKWPVTLTSGLFLKSVACVCNLPPGFVNSGLFL